jgi:hypothetical protein
MDEDLKQKLQIGLAIAIVLVGARTAYIMYERKHPDEGGTPREAPNVIHHELTADDYVYERPFYGYDLETTKKALAGQTVWMKAGNYFHARKVDGKHVTAQTELETVPPLETMEVVDVVLGPIPDAREMLAVFRRPGRPELLAVPIGIEDRLGRFRIDVENVLFRQDPRQLYKHWSKETWAAIDRHEALKGMNEQQVWLAYGYGTPVTYGDYGSRTVHYENAGKPKEVQFASNQAVEIKDAQPLSSR